MAIKCDPELSLNLLKTILTLLEKFEKMASGKPDQTGPGAGSAGSQGNRALPVAAIRQSKLIEHLVVLIDDKEDPVAGEVAKSCLSAMIQISYLSPNEFTS